MLVFQAALMFSAIPVVGSGSGNVWLLVLLASFIGFNYGTNLAIFPSFAKDFWGLKNFGTNYGILFSAWGVGGFVMGRVSQMIQASTGSYNMCFVIAGVSLLFAAALTLRLKPATAVQPVLELKPARARLRVGSSWVMARPKRVKID